MKTQDRIDIYMRPVLKNKTVDGIYRLTPRQRRRVKKKWHRDQYTEYVEEQDALFRGI